MLRVQSHMSSCGAASALTTEKMKHMEQLDVLAGCQTLNQPTGCECRAEVDAVSSTEASFDHDLFTLRVNQ